MAFTAYATVGKYQVTPSAITSVQLTVTPPSPVLTGTPVQLNALASGGFQPEYKFYALYPQSGANQVVLIQDYSLSSSCTWTPTIAAGYTLVACAREHGATLAYTAYGTAFNYNVLPDPTPVHHLLHPDQGRRRHGSYHYRQQLPGSYRGDFWRHTGFRLHREQSHDHRGDSEQWNDRDNQRDRARRHRRQQHELYLPDAHHGRHSRRHPERSGKRRHAGELAPAPPAGMLPNIGFMPCIRSMAPTRAY